MNFALQQDPILNENSTTGLEVNWTASLEIAADSQGAKHTHGL